MYIFQTDVLLDKWMKRVKVHDILLLPSLHTVAESEEMPRSLSPLVLAQHPEESKLSLPFPVCFTSQTWRLGIPPRIPVVGVQLTELSGSFPVNTTALGWPIELSLCVK